MVPVVGADPNIIPHEVKVTDQRSQLLTNIHVKMLELSAKNQQLEKDLTELRDQTRKFVESVKANRTETLRLPSSSTLLHQGADAIQLP